MKPCPPSFRDRQRIDEKLTSSAFRRVVDFPSIIILSRSSFHLAQKQNGQPLQGTVVLRTQYPARVTTLLRTAIANFLSLSIGCHCLDAECIAKWEVGSARVARKSDRGKNTYFCTLTAVNHIGETCSVIIKNGETRNNLRLAYKKFDLSLISR